MTSLNLVDTDPAELRVDAVVIGVHSVAEPVAGQPPLLLASGAESITAAFDGRLSETLSLLGAAGAPGEVTKLASLGAVTAPLVVAVGLGPEPTGAAPAAEILRRAAGSAVRALAGATNVALSLPLSDDPGGADAVHALRAIAEGALLGSYRFAAYKTKPAPGRRDPVDAVSVHVPDAGDETMTVELARVVAVTSAVCRARDWVNCAPNDLRPPDFADAIAEAATKAGLQVEVLDETALKEAGYGGILAVGQGSEAPPRLVRLSYRPEGSPARHVALVGKGITFDSGGVSIKPAQGMWEMKSDMAGAAAVAATMLAIAALTPNVAVTGYAALAENMPSGSAYRPGDVVRMYGGKHVEVLNTDAEGRMVLADAIVRAGEDNPDYLVETSTLTGGQVVALGKRVAGLMGDAAFMDRLKKIGDEVGEPAWPMPIPDDVRKGMESEVADISQVNAGMDRAGHMLQGGAFLSEFVPSGLPWAHLDIAGPAYHSGEPFGYWTKGGTGVPVRTLTALIEDVAANG
ncbi:leucyl aminopeptidase [Planosporangium flavigriseum]|uniref:Probable cytosol aminopeptidase n=1 Tax=Planosporangium flavigriseum TaxID=373681 RepID=A0A8J3LL14_9ACTN|nr:leucyl aminopeptidase [Planosporangium flavigriseum]GIG72598.1 putative cytosol aminopeptidase [Planosporangium flavigriseum]